MSDWGVSREDVDRYIERDQPDGDEMTVEEMKAQDIAYLTYDAYLELIRVARLGHHYILARSQAFEELSVNNLINVGERLTFAYGCTITDEGREYIKRYRAVYTFDEHGDYFGD